jgi:hypothetical protein
MAGSTNGIDQTDQWLARIELSVSRLSERLQAHTEQPWHASFITMYNDLAKRLDRMESAFITTGRWMIGTLILVVAILAAILGVAWKLLEVRPPA